MNLEDPELLLLTALATPLAGVRLCTETPPDLDQIARTLQVVRAGGGKNFTLAAPRMVLHSWANGGPAAVGAVRQLAADVDAAVLALRGETVDGICITWVEQTSGPSNVPDPNPALRHMTATYSFRLAAA